MEVTKEQFKNWIENPVTKAFFKEIEIKIDDQLRYIAAGSTIVKNADLSTDHVVGKIQAYVDVLNVQFEEPEEKIEYDH